MSWDLEDFRTDRRANRLMDWKQYKGTNGSWYYLGVNGCPDVCGQIEDYVLTLGGGPFDPARLRTRDRAQWSQMYRYPGPKRPEASALAFLLSEVLTLRSVPELDAALALDFYTEPDPDSIGLRRSEVGDLCYKLKYRGRRAAGTEICDRLAEIVRRHPAYSTADRIVVVPSTTTGMSELIGRSVAHRLDLPHVIATETTGSTHESKLGTPEVPKLYTVDEDLFAETVIVLDDVYHSGQSLRGVAKAASAAGAIRALGLVAARNLRN